MANVLIQGSSLWNGLNRLLHLRIVLQFHLVAFFLQLVQQMLLKGRAVVDGQQPRPLKAVLRRARGMRDETMLLLKLKWATARPIRSSRDLAKFLNFQLHSNR